MPFYRVNPAGTFTRLTMLAAGPDGFPGASTLSRGRVHQLGALAFARAPRGRVDSVRVLGFPLADDAPSSARGRIHEVSVHGIETDPPAPRGRVHEVAVVGVAA